MEDGKRFAYGKALGSLPPQRLGLAYAVIALTLDAVATFIPSLAIPAGILALALIAALVFIVAFLRDDDTIEAGVLIALITSIATLASQALIASVQARSLAPLVMTLPGAFLGIAIRAVVWGAIGAGLVWLLRRMRGDRSTPRPPSDLRRRRFR